MADTYGTAFMKIHHDIAVDVRERPTSREFSMIHDIDTEKYLTLHRTETELSSLLRKTHGVYVEPLFFTDSGFRHDLKTRHIHEIEANSRVLATLTRHIFHVHNALIDKGMAPQKGINTYYFQPGELETLLKKAKEELFRDLDSIGLRLSAEQIYPSLTGNSPILI